MTKKPINPWIRPPKIAFYMLLIGALFHYFFPIYEFFKFPYNLTGITIIAFGFLLATWGVKTFNKNKAPIIPGTKPEVVVKTGPFVYSRNPMYLSLLLILLGISVLLGSVGSLVSPVLFFIIFNFFFIPFEERLMTRVIGKEYLVFKHSVRRWI